jgi:hypothetical protein
MPWPNTRPADVMTGTSAPVVQHFGERPSPCSTKITRFALVNVQHDDGVGDTEDVDDPARNWTPGGFAHHLHPASPATIS